MAEVGSLTNEIAEVKIVNTFLKEQVAEVRSEMKEVSGAVSTLSADVEAGFGTIRDQLSELNRGFRGMETSFGDMANELRIQK